MPELDVQLVETSTFEAFMEDVRRRAMSCTRTSLRYRDLAHLAGLHQDLGNALAKLIYQAASASLPQGLACRRGCSVCCQIPSSVREVEGSNFTMSILDAVTLVEAYGEIKAADPTAPEKALRALAAARNTKALVSCPHLKGSGACGIYERRPVACKIWFSADLGLCIRNRDLGYPGSNPWTQESKRLLIEFEAPFLERVREIAPDVQLYGDFLEIMDEIAKLDRADLLDDIKRRIDAGELDAWYPFGAAGS